MYHQTWLYKTFFIFGYIYGLVPWSVQHLVPRFKKAWWTRIPSHCVAIALLYSLSRTMVDYFVGTSVSMYKIGYYINKDYFSLKLLKETVGK